MERTVITKLEFQEIKRPGLQRLCVLSVTASQAEGFTVNHNKTETFAIPMNAESRHFIGEPQQIKRILEEAIKVLEGMTP